MQIRVVGFAVVVSCVGLKVSLKVVLSVSDFVVVLSGVRGGITVVGSFGMKHDCSSSDRPMSLHRNSGAKSKLESTHEVRVRCCVI